MVASVKTSPRAKPANSRLPWNRMKRLGAIATRKSAVRSSLRPMERSPKGRLECFAHSAAATAAASPAESCSQVRQHEQQHQRHRHEKGHRQPRAISNRSTITTLMRRARSKDEGICKAGVRSDVMSGPLWAWSEQFQANAKQISGASPSHHFAGLIAMLDAAVENRDIAGLHRGGEEPDKDGDCQRRRPGEAADGEGRNFAARNGCLRSLEISLVSR